MAQPGSYYGQIEIREGDIEVNGEELAKEEGIALILDDESGGLIVNNRDESTFGTPGYGSLTLAANSAIAVDGNSYQGGTGDYSLCSGYDVTASGYGSMAQGYLVEASGTLSFASGWNVKVSGYASAALGTDLEITDNYAFSAGRHNVVSNWYGSAIGCGLLAKSYCVTVVGQANTDYTISTSLNAASNPAFIVGNGDLNSGSSNDAATRSDALVVYLGGEVVAPSLTESIIDSADDKCLVTKEWVLAQLS